MADIQPAINRKPRTSKVGFGWCCQGVGRIQDVVFMKSSRLKSAFRVDGLGCRVWDLRFRV